MKRGGVRLKRKFDSKVYSKNLTVHEPISLQNSVTSKKIFWDFCDKLFKAGILSELYVDTVALCANALTEYKSYSYELKNKGGPVLADGSINPYVKMRNEAEKNYRDYIKELGLSPKATLTLKLDMSDEEEEKDDF